MGQTALRGVRSSDVWGRPPLEYRERSSVSSYNPRRGSTLDPGHLMHIDAHDQLAGQPIVAVRGFLRRNASSGFRLSDAQDAFGPAAGHVVAFLEKEGYVEGLPEFGSTRYHNTIKGGALSLASAAKPVRRAIAQKRLDEFLERCREVRVRPDMLFKVSRAVLFGSMLSDKASVGDVDIAVTLAPKETDRDKHFALYEAQFNEAARNGVRFSNFVDQMAYPEVRVRQFLKGKSRVLQLVLGTDGILKTAAQRVIYEDPG